MEVSEASSVAGPFAETVNFVAAVKWQQKALELSTEEDRERLTKYLEFYQARKPFRGTFLE